MEVRGTVVSVNGLPVIAVYLVGLGGSEGGAGGITVLDVSLAVEPVFQVPVEGERVRVKGDVVEIAVIVPVASAPPPTSTTVSPTTISARSVASVRVS